jgi:AcrR family transcriptional regulator
MLNMRSARRSEDDLTARAAIRNAALGLFADDGPDAVSVRRIATTAGVSPALVLHHFGSKAGLREAVDRYVAGQLDELLTDDGAAEVADTFAHGAPASFAEIFARVFPPGSPVPAYLRRLLLAGDPAAVELFHRWHTASRRLMDELIESGVARESADPEVRAAFLLASDVALLLLRDPLTATLGFDPMSEDGLTRWAAEVADVLRTGVLLPPDDSDDAGQPHPRRPQEDQ